jgi:hypothetical protein
MDPSWRDRLRRLARLAWERVRRGLQSALQAEAGGRFIQFEDREIYVLQAEGEVAVLTREEGLHR